jgi:hypothetical protein
MNGKPLAQTQVDPIHSTPSGGAQHAWVLWRYWLLREFKTRYAGSVLGVAWAVIQPLASLAIFYVLFGLILAVRVPGLAASNGYLLHLLAGLAIWLPFTDAIGRGVGSLAAYEDFLRKQPMPAEILPAVSVGGSLLVLGIGYGLLLVLSITQGRPFLHMGLVATVGAGADRIDFWPDAGSEHGAFLVARCGFFCRVWPSARLLSDPYRVPAGPSPGTLSQLVPAEPRGLPGSHRAVGSSSYASSAGDGLGLGGLGLAAWRGGLVVLPFHETSTRRGPVGNEHSL